MARARRVKAERQSVAWALLMGLTKQPLPIGPVRVLLTRVAPSKGLDGDNLQGALKAVRDQVAAFLDRDDADPSIAWSYAQRRGAKGEWQVEIHIEEVNHVGEA